MNEHPLMLEGWLKFNEYKWGFKSQRLKLSISDNGPKLETVIYIDKKGRIRMPRLNPYLPIVFYPTSTNVPFKLRYQWLSVSKLLVDEFNKRGLGNTIVLSPEITDVRSWQWEGFLADPRYTFYLNLPINFSEVDYSVKKNLNKAKSNNFYIQRDYNFEAVIECLSDTEDRQDFDYGLTKNDLELALKLLGEENLRCYIVFSPDGEPASARIVLKGNNGLAIDWVAGTKRKFLKYGVSDYIVKFALEDLANVGVRVFDYCGANLPTVQNAKSRWGGELKVFYAIRALNIRTFLVFGLTWFKSHRRNFWRL